MCIMFINLSLEMHELKPICQSEKKYLRLFKTFRQKVINIFKGRAKTIC